MARTDTSNWNCTIARSANLLADQWTILVLREAFMGTRRFDTFTRHLGIARNILTNRLTLLVDEGLLSTIDYQQRPVRHEYRLTEKGHDAYPVLAAMAAYGERWLVGPDGPPVQLHHSTCDHDMSAVVVCSHCRDPLSARDVAVRPYRAPTPA